MTSHPRKQTIAKHILPNISRSKSNQTMRFGQFIEDNMRNTFLEKSFTKCVGETSPIPCFKNQNRAYVLINSFTQFVYNMSNQQTKHLWLKNN